MSGFASFIVNYIKKLADYDRKIAQSKPDEFISATFERVH
jgi:hypothetical protein